VKTLAEKGLTHSLKKAPGAGKKRKKNNAEADSGKVSDTNGIPYASKDQSSKPAVASVPSPAVKSNGIKNAATASLTAKVLQEQEERNKRRKMENNPTLEKLFSSRDQTKPIGKSSDFMSRGFTIPANDKR